MTVILASQSNIRAQLLRNAGLDFQVQPADVDETPTGDPFQRAGALASLKAQTVSQNAPDCYVIGADQVGCLVGGPELQKPTDVAAARAQLSRMAGQTHQFRSAASLWFGGQELGRVEEDAWVTFRNLPKSALDWYLSTGEWQGCCGGYQIENRGIQLVEKIEGSMMAIYGLPLVPLLHLLNERGLLDASGDRLA